MDIPVFSDDATLSQTTRRDNPERRSAAKSPPTAPNRDGNGGQPLITALVGMAIENIALRAMDPVAPLGASGLTVQDQINALTENRQGLKSLSQDFTSVMPTMSPSDTTRYSVLFRASLSVNHFATRKTSSPRQVKTAIASARPK